MNPRRLPASLLALLLGLLSAFAFAPVGWWPLMPLAFAGLAWLLARSPSLPRALFAGWAFGVGQFVLGLNWIATAFTYQAAMPPWLGWIAVVLLSLYLAVYPALAAGLAWRFGQRSPLALVIALSAGWALTEWLRATMFTGFAWNPVGAVWADVGPVRGIATLIGTYGLSLLTVYIGGLLWRASTLRAAPADGVKTTSRRTLLLAAALPTALVLLFALMPGPSRSDGAARPIRIVQPNIGQEDKWREGLDEEAFQRLAALSAGGTSPRLLFWPEVAVPVAFQAVPTDPRLLPVALPPAARAASLLRPGDILVTGAFALTVDAEGRVTGSTNSVMPIDPQGRILGRYDKAHLVPYGEYLPMRPLLTAIGLSQLAPGVGDTMPGPGPRNLELAGWGRMGLQVCYEIIFSGEVVDRANRPDFLFNPSNDAWFGAWGPPQHLAQARLRAAEEGLPIIRSTPTGISALIDADGRLLKSLPWRTAGVIDGFLPQAERPTFFSRHGNVIPLALAFLLLIIAVGMDGRARYRRGI
ncbi:apolipoprotein N-acyltransferase [Sphingomonas swuensis]|uniref:Apolipoprotein N-acyltransferase n=1 Tax=Sphingomonas swuensis TaxID=977800 RepID=A0ABP7SMR3_9SPHN